MIFRKKRLPDDLRPAHDAFERVLEVLEPAKVAITDVLPGTRMPGRPLHDALAAYQEGLEHASDLMPGWRHPDLEDVWRACEEGLGRALALTHRARDEGVEPVGFEGMLGLVEELLDPLDPFVQAEERFRRLRSSARTDHGA
jgi:hypothetical protein